jgi:methyl-accepting chemotaxis protein
VTDGNRYFTCVEKIKRFNAMVKRFAWVRTDEDIKHRLILAYSWMFMVRGRGSMRWSVPLRHDFDRLERRMNSTWTIGKRIGAGFTIAVVALAIVAGWSIYGFNGVVGNLGDAVACNVLRNEITQREVDHLKWAKAVSDLLTDDTVTKLTVQTDPHKCAFGQWYYGEGRKQAELLVPGIREALAAIEEPHKRLHESAVAIGEAFHQADVELPAFLAEKESDHLKWINACLTLFVQNLPALDLQTDPHMCGLGQFLYGEKAQRAATADPELGRLLEALKGPHEKLHQSSLKIQEAWRQRHLGLREGLMDWMEDHRVWAAKVSQAAAMEDASFEVQTDPDLCAFGKFLHGEQCAKWCAEFPELKAALEACRDPHDQLHASAIEIKAALEAGDGAKAKQVYAEQTVPALNTVAKNFHDAIAAESQLVDAQQRAREIFDQETLPALQETQVAMKALRARALAGVQGIKKAGEIFATQTTPALTDVQKWLGEITKTTHEAAETRNASMQTQAASSRTMVTAIGAGGILAAIVLSFLIARSLIKLLKRVVAGLNEGAAQVYDASAQVSTASQQLAEGASEQASSLEETSSAIEEMASSMRVSADNARQANQLAGQARTAAADGDKTVTRLNATMGGINESSEKIGKIIKVIEEIAFQTNLLALNAAVEAARAGEHGKGFAVVAEEVRNLAKRAASAARETTGLIEGAAGRAREGVTVAQDVGKVLGAIVGDVAQVSDLVGGISTASQEQAQGVEQINVAISELDKVTQNNAANSEESAAAAEELSAQSENLRNMVGELLALVGGQGAQAAAGETGTKNSTRKSKADKTVHAPAHSSASAKPKANSAPRERVDGQVDEYEAAETGAKGAFNDF